MLASPGGLTTETPRDDGPLETTLSENLNPERDVDRLRDDLDRTRRELAEVRQRLEVALEESFADRRRLERAEADLVELTESLTAADESGARPAVRARVAHRLRRRSSADDSTSS